MLLHGRCIIDLFAGSSLDMFGWYTKRAMLRLLYMSVVISIPDRGGDDLWITAMLESETLPDLLDLISSKYTAWK